MNSWLRLLARQVCGWLMASEHVDKIRDLSEFATPSEEYWAHVSPQHELPIAPGRIPNQGYEKLNVLADALEQRHGRRFQAHVKEQLLDDPSLLEELRTLLSISDKRLYLDLSYLFSRTPDDSGGRPTLCGCLPHRLTRHSTSFFIGIMSRGPDARRNESASLIAQYLTERGLAAILAVYAALDNRSRLTLVKHLITPGQFQQNEAKRRGHGAEMVLAELLKAVGAEIVPPDKDTNPMGAYDPNIDLDRLQITPREAGQTISCDIAVTDEEGNLRVWIVSLVQSSDPGQFGVNKSDEVLLIRDAVDTHNASSDRHVELWGLVDGVGYSENKTGTIDKMLPAFHEFIQVKSIYKAGLALHRLGLAALHGVVFDPTHYAVRSADLMTQKYVAEGVERYGTVADCKHKSEVVPGGWASLLMMR